MSVVTNVIQLLAVLIAALLLGNWYLAEVKKARLAKKPWYAPYISLPGLLIITAIIILPLALRFLADH
ncbi:MAG: hypothetical protein HKM93_06585 [Desulfobacteraceae bacterium]|nr:hypothetical protein [Desulfobacteraceae bacterium]